MITKHFAYHAPTSTAEAVEILRDAGAETELIGGGTWVVPEMTSGKRRPSCVVDLARTGLRRIEAAGDVVVLGATATYSDLLGSDLVRARLPMMRALALGITGGIQICNRGTIGGSACYANPNSDVPAALVALDATIRLRSADGLREAPAADFFLGAYRSDVRPNEVIEEIAITPDHSSRTGYYKFKLCESSWPIVTAAFVERADRRYVVLGGVHAAPLRVDLSGAEAGEEIAAAVQVAVTEPYDDALATGAYKRAIAGPIAARSAEQLAGA